MAVGGVVVALLAGWLVYRIALLNPDEPDRGAGEILAATLDVDGVERSYLLYLPEGYAGEPGLPLVVNLHGLSSSAQNQIDRSGFNAVADRERLIVVYPNAQGGGPLGLAQWDVRLSEGGEDDVFIEALIDELIVSHGIDGTRVYATGLSYGSIMTYTLACVLSERFAAVGGVAGGLPRDLESTCGAAPRAVPLIHIHGDSDNIVPFGGIGDLTLGADESVAAFVSAHECAPDLVRSAVPDIDLDDGTTTTRQVAVDCESGGAVELYVVHGGGHNWPGGTRTMRIFFGAMSRDYDASTVLWDFFAQHRLDPVG